MQPQPMPGGGFQDPAEIVGTNPELQARFNYLSPEQKSLILQSALIAASNNPDTRNPAVSDYTLPPYRPQAPSPNVNPVVQ
jgi:hypothetical protein